MDITNEDLKDERPRRGLFKDPAAVPVWAGVLALDEATQHDVLAELRVRLVAVDERQGDLNKRRAKAIAALRGAAARLGGKSPTITEYRRLLRENPGLDWPTDGLVRRAFGAGRVDDSWNTALEQAHLDAVPEPMAAEPSLGPQLTDEELMAALRESAVDLGETPTSTAYMQWVRRPDVACRPGRRPRAIGSFQRAFGSWTDAVSAAGLDPHQSRLRPQFSDEQLFRCFDEVRRRNDGQMPSRTVFSTIRREIIAEREAAAASSETGVDETPGPSSFPTDVTCLTRTGGSWVKFREAYKEWKASDGDAS